MKYYGAHVYFEGYYTFTDIEANDEEEARDIALEEFNNVDDREIASCIENVDVTSIYEEEGCDGNILAETVTGFVGQILDECEYDEHAHELLQTLYDIANKEVCDE